MSTLSSANAAGAQASMKTASAPREKKSGDKRGSRRWTRLFNIFIWFVAAFALVVVFNLARNVDWRAVLKAIHSIPTTTLLLAAGLVVVGYAAYGSFDLLARRYVDKRLPAGRVLGIAAISYALNLNLGVLIGGLAVRLRLYANLLGLRRSTILRITGFSVTTNWIGYGLIAGAVFASGVTPIPASWHVGGMALRAAGAVLMLGGLAYILFCWRSTRRHWTVRGHRIVIPSGRTAVTQCALAILSWCTMGAIMYALLQAKVPYLMVLGVLLCTSMASVIVRIPGGLGTTEAIFVGALAGQLPASQVLGAALVYRALYALLPLCIGGLSYLILEARQGVRAVQRNRES
ncbi:lysylphosphatidylglycerol synthase domain-containing protein [Bordetella genomosp. 13]|uniref:lysylphosphatidylglycerol synthase domain-containing protein n=1 Tax=Bordetella genomosp. 13 TaxID=463040 RepID=UPI0011A7E456|nr:lysylphosphatidylglycerol synthase domain-containing protein [Bordetella genomosp. 13]